MREELVARGMTLTSEHCSAHVVLLNTCTVTAAADSQAREAIRKIHRSNPAARIIVTGCYAQRAPEELATIEGVSWIVGNSHQSEIPQLVSNPGFLPSAPLSRLDPDSTFISLSQLEAEKHDAPTGHVDLAAVAARVAGEFAHENRVRFERPLAAITVAGDVRQLEQLVRNLVDNALKYGDADQPVEIALAGGDAATLVVRDHGPGIAPEHLPHLTRRFYRTDPGRSRAGGGTGLGLAIVKHIVERHRGTLDIASTLGDGTTVKVVLPVI